jgi:hypothetical protein
MDLNLTAKALKCTVMLDAAEIGALPEPTTSRVVLRVRVAGRTVKADVAAKAVRKARATVAQHGAEGVVVLIQGTVEEVMRVALGQLAGMSGELAAKLWHPGSCADDQTMSLYQTQRLAEMLGAGDRTIVLRLELLRALHELLSATFKSTHAALSAALVQHGRLEGEELAAHLATPAAMRRKHGDFAVGTVEYLRKKLPGYPSDDAMLREIGNERPRGAWREDRGGGTEH